MPHYFKQLNYTLGDEDPTAEFNLLPEGTARALAIADCGSRIVPLLAKNPRHLVCVDINREQLAVCELRLALLKHVSLAEYKGFLGFTDTISPQARQAMFSELPLQKPTREVLHAMFTHIDWGSMLYCGKFEQMLRTLRRVNSAITGRSGRQLFECESLAEQLDYYKNHFPRWRWKMVLALLGNSTALNSLLYRGDFPKKNIPGSHFHIYDSIFHRLFTEWSVRKNFFLQMLFFGEIRYPDAYPLECQPEIFNLAKKGAENCEILLELGDVFQRVQEHRNLDFVSLSDVPSFLPPAQEHSFLKSLRSQVAEGAKVVVRAHLRRPTPDLTGFRDVSTRYPNSHREDSTQLWSFHIYEPIPTI
ncbi:DUF3419 family protein [Chitiniphilus purpureus]|uniref:DUF3419 family protein n=1 Tax=Chitiniphilus purpureus TaxID=2981137 RepID=A0ABY6DME8_9NEIS|nr:DUF3419 family protein [Chitiniphilus sp. CD1]UXY15182.1 DUF3419 family protein [Chitiniphilus sp. CD1]